MYLKLISAPESYQREIVATGKDAPKHVFQFLILIIFMMNNIILYILIMT